MNLFVESQKGNASHWTELTNQIPWLVSNAPVQLVLGGKWDTALNRYTDSSQHFTGKYVQTADILIQYNLVSRTADILQYNLVSRTADILLYNLVSRTADILQYT